MKREITLSIDAGDALKRLGENLAQARDARGWSQDEAATRALMSRTTYRAIELGSSSVAIGHYLSVLDLFGMVGAVKDLAAAHLDEEGRRLRVIKGRHK